MIREAIIVPERNVASWGDNDPATIWYFGDSYAGSIALRKRLSDAYRFGPVGDVINRWANDLFEPLRNLDGAVAIRDPMAWAASGVGSRGRFETPLVAFACCYAAFLEVMEGGGRHVFVVADEEFGRLLYDQARARGWVAGWEGAGTPLRRRWPALAFRIAHTIRDRMRSLRHYGQRRRLLKRLRRQRPIAAEKLRAADTVFVLWGRADTFTPQGRGVRDGWFADLPALLEKEGRRLAYLVQPLDWGDPYEAIAKNALASDEAVLLIEDACTTIDLLRNTVSTLRAPATVSRFEVRGLDLTPAVRAALRHEVRRGAPTLAHLQARAGELFRRLGMQPRTIVHLYEGQPWERALRVSVRRALPQARVVAVQHMPLPPRFLNSVPSDREINTGEMPDNLMLLGPKVVEFLGGLGCREDVLAVGGALRFKTVKNLVCAADKQSALCCVGVDWHESHELADKAAQAATRFPDLRLIINFNPLAPPALKDGVKSFVLDRLTPDARARVEFSDLGIRDLIASVGLVLYSDTNAAYEAFAAGCELIFVGRDNSLDYDKLRSGWANHCRSVDEIAGVIGRWLQQPAAADREARLRRLADYLADVDYGAFLQRIC